MKKIDLPPSQIAVIVLALLLGLVLSGMVIKGPKPGSLTATKVNAIPSSFPDVKNNPGYSFYLNSSALDPTQAIRIGNSQNNSPFNGSQ